MNNDDKVMKSFDKHAYAYKAFLGFNYGYIVETAVIGVGFNNKFFGEILKMCEVTKLIKPKLKRANL